MLFRIQIRRDTTQNWQAVNPVLRQGEFGVEWPEDGADRLKIGNGHAAWNDLPYATPTAREFGAHVNDTDAHGIDALKNKVAGLEQESGDRLDGMSERVSSLEHRTEGLASADAEINDRLNSLASTVGRNKTETDEALAGVGRDMGGLGRRVGDLETAGSENAGNIRDLGETVRQNEFAASNAIDNLRGRTETLETNVTRNRTDINGLRNDLDTLANSADFTGLAELTVTVDGLKAGVNGLTPRVGTLETNDANNRNAILQISGDLATAKARMSGIEAEQGNINNAVDNFAVQFNGKIDGINSYIVYLKSDVTNIKWDILNIRNNMLTAQQLKNDVITLGLRLDGHDAALENINGEIEAITGDIAVLSGITSVRGSVPTFADLPDPADFIPGMSFIVEADEHHEGVSAVYVVVENNGAREWRYLSRFVVDLSDYYTRDAIDRKIERLDTAIETETRDRERHVGEAVAAEARARQEQVDALNAAITDEAAARESQVYELNNAMTDGFAHLNGELQATNRVLDGVRTTSLHGAYLTRELGGTTDVPIILFRSFSNFQAGKTLVFDDNGTQGVFIENVDSATIRVMTKSISHMSDLKPTLLGSVPTRADLPEISEEAAAIFGRMPRIDDHAFVLNDETHDDLRVIWYVIDIVEIPYEGDAYGMIPFPPPPPTITIVWGNPIPINRDDFQAQTGAVDSGSVLTGGATPGTFGESISIDIEATEESNNLITSDAVYRAMERIREENSLREDETYTGQNWIDGRPIFRQVLTGNTGASSPTTFGFIEGLGGFVDIRGHIRNPLFIDNINTVDINFETGELRGHWPEHGVINDPVWSWWNVGSPTINFAASGSTNAIGGFNVTRLGGAAGGVAWGPAGFAMGGNRFTIGAVSPSGTTETTPSMRIAGVLDFTMPTLLEIDFGGASGTGAFQVSINNNTISMANSVHGNASRVVNQTMSGSGTFQHLIDTREWTDGRQFLDSATITLRGEGTLTMQVFAIRLLRRTSWENSEFNLIFEYTRNN